MNFISLEKLYLLKRGGLFSLFWVVNLVHFLTLFKWYILCLMHGWHFLVHLFIQLADLAYFTWVCKSSSTAFEFVISIHPFVSDFTNFSCSIHFVFFLLNNLLWCCYCFI